MSAGQDNTAASEAPATGPGRSGGADGKRVSPRRREHAPRPAPGSAQGAGRRRGGGATQASSPVYVARRPLKIGKTTRQPGEEVPEAAGWHRVEAWIRSGHLERRRRRPKGAST